MNVDLNRRARIEQKSVTLDYQYRTETVQWVLVGVVWCNIQDVLPSRSDAIKNDIAIGSKQARLRMRYRKDLDSSMRFVIDGVVFQIISDFAEIGKQQHMECMIEKYTS